MVRNGIILEGIIYELKESPTEAVCKNCDLGEVCKRQYDSEGPCYTFDVPFSYHFKKYRNRKKE